MRGFDLMRGPKRGGSHPAWKLWQYFGMLAIVVFLVGITIWSAQYYVLYSKTDAVFDAAEVSTDAASMEVRLVEYKAALESNHMTEGYNSLIKTPMTSMANHAKLVDGMISSLRYEIVPLDHSSTAYRTALADMRSNIAKVPNPAEGWVWVRYGVWVCFITAAFGLLCLIFYCLQK